jgi:hypothetical protein
MRRAVLLLGVIVFSACGGDANDGANTGAASAAAARSEPIVIRENLFIAAEEHSEPIATGTILAGSRLGGTPFCTGGTILDSHASLDPKMKPYLIDRKITCPDGTVRIGLTPKVGVEPQGQTQKGTWTIVGGTGAFEGLGGRGKSEAVYGPTPDSAVHETLTGAVTR